MQAERQNKASVMTSSTEEEHSGELVDRHQPLAGVVKRKRTKRPRHQPLASSSASSSESTTTEEEDMAHCLILLAQGGGVGAVVDSKPSSAQPPAAAVIMQQAAPPTIAATQPPTPQVVTVKSERYTSRKYTEAATTEDGVKAGFYVYECRTCNKCFPTFQALGGHRASHKKPRLLLNSAADEEINVTKTSPMMMTTASPPPPPPSTALPEVTTALSLNSNHHHHHVTAGISSNNNSKLRVHECSICGAEFASGQALGGHMRRHRPLNAPDRAVTATIDTKKEISIVNLELDLNLPAPLSDEEATAVPTSSSLPPPPVVLGLGQFNDGNKAGLMLTASALVDCHY